METRGDLVYLEARGALAFLETREDLVSLEFGWAPRAPSPWRERVPPAPRGGPRLPLIRVKRIYNFLLFHASYMSLLNVFTILLHHF